MTVTTPCTSYMFLYGFKKEVDGVVSGVNLGLWVIILFTEIDSWWLGSR